MKWRMHWNANAFGVIYYSCLLRHTNLAVYVASPAVIMDEDWQEQQPMSCSCHRQLNRSHHHQPLGDMVRERVRETIRG
jgi:hypothetical protein